MLYSVSYDIDIDIYICIEAYVMDICDSSLTMSPPGGPFTNVN